MPLIIPAIVKSLFEMKAKFKQERSNLAVKALTLTVYPIIFTLFFFVVLYWYEIPLHRKINILEKSLTDPNNFFKLFADVNDAAILFANFHDTHGEELLKQVNSTVNTALLAFNVSDMTSLAPAFGNFSQEQLSQIFHTSKLLFPYFKEFCTNNFSSAPVWISHALLALFLTFLASKYLPNVLDNFINFDNAKGFLKQYYSDCLNKSEIVELSSILDKHTIMDFSDVKVLIMFFFSLPPRLRDRLEQDYRAPLIEKAALLTTKPDNPARIQQLPSDIKKLILGETIGKNNASMIFSHINKPKIDAVAGSKSPTQTSRLRNSPLIE